MSQPLHLGDAQLDELFPFHLAVDRQLRVVRSGPALRRVCPAAAPGVRMADICTIDRPRGVTDADRLAAHAGGLVVLSLSERSLRLKGQVIAVGDALVFVGSPWVDSADALGEMGVSLDDFAAHDPVIDCLFLLQAQQTAIDDLRRLTETLRAHRSELKQANQQLVTEYMVTRILAESASIDTAAPELLHALAETMECQLGVLWWQLDDAARMSARAVWQQPGLVAGAFVAATRAGRIAPGAGLPGLVWRTGACQWIEDVSDGPTAMAPARADAARESGLRGAYALPVVVRDQVLGVVELVATAPGRRPVELRETLANVGMKIGQFAELKRVEGESDRRRRERAAELEHKMETAIESSRLKSEFLANVSHEIRTPMNAVIGMTELLADTELSEQQRSYVSAIRTSGDALLSIVNSGLDLSKIEAGKLELENIDFDLRATAEEACRMFAEGAHKKGVELSCRIDPAIPRALFGDPHRLRQVLTNLLGNAVKFTDQGKVALEVGLVAREGDSVRLKIAVRDTGIGIAAENLAKVFEPFAQADGSTTRRYGGTGLGLVIVKQLVELMGSEIRLHSELGAGSTFWFEPAFGRATEDTAWSPSRDLVGRGALVVSANPALSATLCELMREFGVTTRARTSGRAAIQALLEAGDGEGDCAIEAVIVDGALDDMGGAELLRTLAASPSLWSVRLAGCAPFGVLEREAQLRAAGARACVGKPVLERQLYEALVELWTQPASRSDDGAGGQGDAAGGQGDAAGGQGDGAGGQGDAAGTPPAPASASPGRGDTVRAPDTLASAEGGDHRLLVVDDSHINQRVIGEFLGKWGMHVTFADDGVQAVEAFEAGSFDLVIMDCQMPRMDGYEATQRIRALEARGARTPIIAVTAHAMRGDRERCIEAGMDDYLIKPIQPVRLRQTLGKWLAATARPHQAHRAVRAADPRAAPAATTAPTAPAAPAATTTPAAPKADDAAAQPKAATPATGAANPVRDADTAAPAADADRWAPDAAVPRLSPDALAALRGLETDGNAGIFAELVKLYLDEGRERLDALHHALAAGDLGALAREAHRLKGSSGNVGAHRLMAMCARIEDLARDGALAAVALAVADVAAELGHVTDALVREVHTSANLAAAS